ncbi:MAG: HAD family phosphatase [Bacteroidota bacterium]
MLDLLRGIDAIIFDFGNVLIDLDYPRIIQEFKKVATKNQDNIRKLIMNSKVMMKFETGEIGPERFRASVNKILGMDLSEDNFDQIWNSMLKSITKERMDKVLKIRDKFDTYILSNSNILHEIAFEEMVMDATGKLSIREYVKKTYFSHEVGMRKPNRDIYEFVIEDINNYASRMLFLDDRLDNIEAARAVGMKAIQIFNPDRQLNEIFGLG